MERKSCAFTGHRDIKNISEVKAKLKEILRELIKKGYTDFYNGGAIGFDFISAACVIELKKEYDITLNMILPCKDQALKWSDDYKKVYQTIIAKSDSVEYIEEKYTAYCMQKRNRALCEKCDILIAYLEKNTGGTLFTVNYAKKLGKDVINIAL